MTNKKEQVKIALKNDNQFVYNFLHKLTSQTEDMDIKDNKGLNKNDKEFIFNSGLLDKSLEEFTNNQLNMLRKMLVKYWKQAYDSKVEFALKQVPKLGVCSFTEFNMWYINDFKLKFEEKFNKEPSEIIYKLVKNKFWRTNRFTHYAGD